MSLFYVHVRAPGVKGTIKTDTCLSTTIEKPSLGLKIYVDMSETHYFFPKQINHGKSTHFIVFQYFIRSGDVQRSKGMVQLKYVYYPK